MRSFGSFHLARTGRHAVLGAGVIAAATLTACSDDATAPRPARVSVPSAADAAILPLRSLVSVRITNYVGKPIFEKPTVRFFAGGDSIDVKDNSPLDKDTTTSTIAASLPRSAWHKVCLATSTESYTFVQKAACKTVPGNTATVDAGTLVMQGYPGLGLRTLNRSGNIIAGGTFKITGPPGSGYQLTVTDGDANDRNPTIGGIVVWVPAPGRYMWCEKVAPPGYLIVLPECGVVDLVWNFGVQTDVKHWLELNSTPF
jgi:hypothetical protein